MLPFIPLLANPPYQPKPGDAATIYYHSVKPERFSTFVKEALGATNPVVNRLTPPNESFQMEDASHWGVEAVVFTPKRASVTAMDQKPEMKQRLAKLAEWRMAPLKTTPGVLLNLDFSKGRPKVGNVVYAYVHKAKPGMFAQLKKAFEPQVPGKFKASFAWLPHFAVAIPGEEKIVSYVFFPNQKIADDMHRSASRGRIIASTDRLRSSYVVHRFVLAGTR